MSILTDAQHLQLRRDTTYVLDRFAAQLRKRLDLTDAMIVAFDRLLDTIREGPTMSKLSKQHAKPKSLDMEKDAGASWEEPDSPGVFEDAQESFSLASDDLSTLLRYCPRPTDLDPQSRRQEGITSTNKDSNSVETLS